MTRPSFLSVFKSLQVSYPAPFPHPPELESGPPDFVGVGTMRSGTTWWHQLIVQHPQVYSPTFFPADFPVKERHFFDRFCTSEFSERDAAEYKQWFPRPPGLLAGEFTPSYIADHWVPELLKIAAPHARILVLFRDPVERYVSAINFQTQQGEPRTPAELAREQTMRGLYAGQMATLLGSFDRRQLLVLQYERCRIDPHGELRRTYAFLDLDASFVPANLTESRNASARTAFVLPHAQRRRLAHIYADSSRQLAAQYSEIDLELWPSAKDAGLS